MRLGTWKLADLREQLLDEVADPIFLHDLDGFIIYVNRAACETYGYLRSELVGLNLCSIIVPNDADVMQARVKEIVEIGELTFESHCVRKDGSVLPLEVHARLVQAGSARLILCTGRDTSERVRGRDVMHMTSFRDALTGLYSRRGFLALAEHQLTAVGLGSGQAYLVLVRVKGLERVRGVWGRQHLDLALIEIANVLRRAFSPADVVARTGEDEFSILTHHQFGSDTAAVVGHLKEMLAPGGSRSVAMGGLSLVVATSAYDPGRPTSIHGLIGAASEAILYGEAGRHDSLRRRLMLKVA